VFVQSMAWQIFVLGGIRTVISRGFAVGCDSPNRMSGGWVKVSRLPVTVAFWILPALASLINVLKDISPRALAAQPPVMAAARKIAGSKAFFFMFFIENSPVSPV